MRGDIRATDVFKDREMLNLLGWGIMDVEWGKGEIGSENIRNFSYVVAQDQDAKFYRRMVYDLIGRYFVNDLARDLWNKFIDHKWVLSEQAGHEINLKVAAQDWMEKHSHDFLKRWTFSHPVPTGRIRNVREPNRGLMGSMASQVVPPLGDLLDSGFSVVNVVGAALRESIPLPSNRAVREAVEPNDDLLAPVPKLHRPSIVGHFLNPFQSRKARRKNQRSDQKTDPMLVLAKVEPEHRGLYYVRLLANLTGHHFKNHTEAAHYWREVLEHKWYMSEQAKEDVGLRRAALDYFRRLNMLAQVESGQEN